MKHEVNFLSVSFPDGSTPANTMVCIHPIMRGFLVVGTIAQTHALQVSCHRARHRANSAKLRWFKSCREHQHEALPLSPFKLVSEFSTWFAHPCSLSLPQAHLPCPCIWCKLYHFNICKAWEPLACSVLQIPKEIAGVLGICEQLAVIRQQLKIKSLS